MVNEAPLSCQAKTNILIRKGKGFRDISILNPATQRTIIFLLLIRVGVFGACNRYHNVYFVLVGFDPSVDCSVWCVVCYFQHTHTPSIDCTLDTNFLVFVPYPFLEQLRSSFPSALSLMSMTRNNFSKNKNRYPPKGIAVLF